MKITKQNYIYAVCSILIVSFCPGFVSSQGIEEIVVTARKRQENLQEVPVSISAFDADFMERKGLDTVSDLGAYTPNLTTTPGPSGSGRGANYYIRGIGQTDWIPTQDPGVGLYLDGVYLGRTAGSLLDLADTERVEVLRGPQGTLFGKNTIGGAVRVVTKKPGSEAEGFGEITGGRFGRLDAKFAYNTPLSDEVFARFSGVYRSNEGFANRSVDGLPAGDDQDIGGRISVMWTPSDDLSILVSSDATRRRAHPLPTSLVEGSTVPVAIPADPRGHPAAGVLPWKDDLDVFGINATLDWDVGALNIKSVTSYREQEIILGADFDGSPIPSNEINLDSNQDQFSQELQFSGQLFDSHMDWLVGFYYLEEDLDFVNTTINGPGPQDVGTIDDVVQETTNFSVFAHGIWHATDALDVTFGFRFTDEEKKAVLTSPLASTTGRNIKLNFDDVTPKVSVDYQLTEDFLVYGVWSEGFKSGGVNGRIVPAFLNTDIFDAEKVTSYELGFKSEWWDSRIRLNVAGFFSDYSNFQTVTLILDPNGIPFFPVSNAGDVDVYGFEVEVDTAVTDKLRLKGNVGYTEESVTRVDPQAFAFTFNSDTELPGSPTWNTFLGLQYTHPTNFGSLFNGSFIFDTDWSYRSSLVFLSILDPASTQKGYSLVNSRVTFVHESGKWELAVWGKNIFDKNYAVFRQNLGGPPFPPNQSFNLAMFGRPAEWGVTFRVRF